MKLGQKLLLVTGSNGPIGSEMIEHFYNLGWIVHGLDNNMRADFIGSRGHALEPGSPLKRECEGSRTMRWTVRHRQGMLDLFRL
jgi:CDP-paratose 2-epimerase